MPTYEYKCHECGDVFDVFQNMSDEPLKTCPECGGAVKRLIGSGAGIIFKGSGFYCTDYRSSNYQQQANKEKDKKDSTNTGKEAGKKEPKKEANKAAKNNQE
ncbi:MAG: FmdB family zinc ribbon protein [Lentisphaeria bacterium]